MIINAICTLLKGCLLEMSIIFSLISSLLKLAWRFYNEKQKEATLRMIEKELVDILLKKEEYGELDKEIQNLYIWLLTH